MSTGPFFAGEFRFVKIIFKVKEAPMFSTWFSARLLTRAKSISTLVGLSVLLFSGWAQADLSRTYDNELTFGVIVEDGPGAGETGDLAIGYDDGLITGVDFETLFGGEFELSMTLFGQTFSDGDDADIDIGFPALSFFFGEVSFLSFSASETSLANPVDIIDPRIDAIFGGDFIDGFYFVSTDGPDPVDPPSVPAPATLLLILSGLLVGRARRRPLAIAAD
ncbi:MAG: hypothetical protein AAGI88_06115 [Pseudomonadota bacterium]